MAKAPVQDRSKVRVDNMLTAFGQLLDENPYHEISSTMVASRANSAVGSFYQFFRSREELADALRDRLAAKLVFNTRANLEGFVTEAVKSRDKVTLVDCLVALHHAMERMCRDEPGARHLPVKATVVAAELTEAFAPHTSYDQPVLYSYVLVAVATSAACVKLALNNPEHGSDMLGLAQWSLQELGKEEA